MSPKNPLTALTEVDLGQSSMAATFEVGLGQSSMAATFLGLVLIPRLEIVCPKYSTRI